MCGDDVVEVLFFECVVGFGVDVVWCYEELDLV